MTKPLRIGLMMQGDRNWIGGTEYIKNIVLALASLPAEVQSTFELSLICPKTIDPSLYKQLQPYLKNIHYQDAVLPPPTLLNRLYWKIFRRLSKQNDPQLEAFLRQQKPETLLRQQQLETLLKQQQLDFVYPHLSLSTGQQPYRSAAWIYDFQHKHLPEFFSTEEVQQRDQLFALIAHQAPIVVLSSKSAESDFHKFFSEAHDKTEVLSFKTSPAPTWYEGKPQQIQQEYFLPDRFFLVSNQFWQHKNHLVVFKALKLLQEKSIYPNVVFTGHLHDHRQPSYADTVLQTIHKLGIAKQVYLVGLIPKLDQIQLMRHSLAVIQPSLFEGWSTLVEDARCLGKRMILSDLPVNLEQDPPNSVFFERNSPEHLAQFLADWWEHLSPGPDPEQEAIAKINAVKEVKAFGSRFLEIAKDH